MTERGIEPSGSHGSALSNDNDHLHNENPRAPNRSSRSNSSSSWKRYLACIAITSLCLIQIGISTMYLTTTENANYSQIMDLPSVQSEVQQTDGNTNNDRSSIDYFINITTPQPLPTLVHFDPRFIGGYRNQHMRFVAFVNFAVENSIPQLLLPSLRWGVAQGEHRGRDVPFDYLFDVAYWNERAERAGLPRLVRYDANVLEGRRRRSGTTDMMDNNNKSTTIACFNTSSNLYSGLDSGLLRNPNTNIRRVNIWDEIGRLDGYAHCRRLPPSSVGQQDQEDVGDEFTHLIAHGGSKGVGRLWADYNAMQRRRGKAKQNTTIDNRTITIHPEHLPVERTINTILRPSEAIRNAIQSAIQSSTTAQKDQQQQLRSPSKVLALHPRIEHDMLHHRCGRFMEQNLTKIFDHLRGECSHNAELLFLAVNIELVMAEPGSSLGSDLRELALENAIVLNRTRTYGMFGNESSVGIPMFESGSRTAENILFPEEQPTDYSKAGTTPRLVTSKTLGITDLVASIVDFFTIIEADRFVGVKGSSFSTDLFSVRYYMGKRGNYILGPEGVEELVGPPPSHSCN
mmetsp:Transcript_14942/g.22517  ORF Transcript_14942/g.22517 Transcript_14942/m.22517 type:complete len:572 (-) Transcript_14942:203-1918(-)